MCVGEAMCFALDSLAAVASEWFLFGSNAEWVERYGHRIEKSRLPRSEKDRLTLAEPVGADGRKVLTAVCNLLAPAWLREIPAIQVLGRIWVQNDFVEDEHLRWRLNDRSWVQRIEQTSLSELTVSTTDGQIWKISSALSYARLLYLYECNDE